MLGHWQTVQTQIRRRKTRRLIRVCTVCLYYRKLRVKRNSLSPLSGPFPQPKFRNNRPTRAVSALINIDHSEAVVLVLIVLCVALWLLASSILPCVIVVFGGSCLALYSLWCGGEGERERGSCLLLCISLVCDLCTICHGLFALPLGVSGCITKTCLFKYIENFTTKK